MKLRLNYKWRVIFLFSYMAFMMLLSSIIIALYGLYIFNWEYEIASFRVSYLIGIPLAFGIVKYWEKFIKRKLHFILVGDNRL